MQPPVDQLGDYLASEEPLVAVSSGALSESAAWTPVTVGLTDRRMLCVSDDGRYATVGYDDIRTIRSRPRTTHSYRGTDHRLLLGAGSFATMLGGAGVLALATNALVPLLALGTVGGLVAATYLRRNPNESAWGPVAEVAERLPFDVDGADARQWFLRSVPERARERPIPLIGSLVVALVSFVALLVLAASALVGLSTLALVGGIALADHAHRHGNDFEWIEIDRERTTEVSVGTDDDRTIHVRCDPSDGLVKAFSEAAFADDAPPDELAPPRA